MTDFNTSLNEKQAALEIELEKYFLNRNCHQRSVIDAMAYSTLGGGKRIRAMLVLGFCEAFGGDYHQGLPFACAVEMIHAYSLIHDDLPCMDDDDYRRGKPSCHKKFGEAIAVLAGDNLLNMAYGILFAQKDALKTMQIGRILSSACGEWGMIGGQVIDIEHEAVFTSGELLREMHGLKTGALIRAAAKTGAIAGGANEADLTIVDKYAKAVGLAFQIQDDILDATSSTDLLGKPVGSDKDNEKTTYVSLYSLKEATNEQNQLFKTAYEQLEKLNVNMDFILNLTQKIESRQS